MTNREIQLKELRNRTMRNIYGIWFMRKVLPALALETGALAAVAFVAQSFLRWGHIINNVLYRWTHHPIWQMDDFWLAALTNTESSVILLMVAAAAAGVFLARDTFRVFRNLFIHRSVTLG